MAVRAPRGPAAAWKFTLYQLLSDAWHRDQQNIQHSYSRDFHMSPCYLERVGQA
jgi:hypothetical protein